MPPAQTHHGTRRSDQPAAAFTALRKASGKHCNPSPAPARNSTAISLSHVEGSSALNRASCASAWARVAISTVQVRRTRRFRRAKDGRAGQAQHSVDRIGEATAHHFPNPRFHRLCAAMATTTPTMIHMHGPCHPPFPRQLQGQLPVVAGGGDWGSLPTSTMSASTMGLAANGDFIGGEG